MKNYRVTVQVNGQVPPLEFFCNAHTPAGAIADALAQVPETAAVVATCHLYAPDRVLMGIEFAQEVTA